mgnify:CR=1 FL=1
MSWFKRLKEGIQTTTKNKKEAPDGLWYKCKECKEASTMKEFKENYYKCPIITPLAIAVNTPFFYHLGLSNTQNASKFQEYKLTLMRP